MATKQKSETVDALRAKANEAIAAKARADEAEAAALKRLQEIRNKPRATFSRRTNEEVLAETVAEREWYEAQAARDLTHASAAAALDAAELAEGDTLATEAAPAILRRELEQILTEEDRLRAELAAVEQRREAVIAASRSSWSALDTRRRASGLPGPIALPAAATTPMGAPIGPPTAVARALVEALTRRVVDGEMPPVKSYKEQLRPLTYQENNLRVEIERQHREDEKRQRQRDAATRAHEQAKAAEQERQRLEREEWAAKVQAEQRERDELIAAQKRREAGNAA